MKWKTSSLSLAGRSTLITSVTSAIPSYSMQTSLLTANNCETLDRCNRRFLWGGTNDNQKISLVAWDSVCKPKSRGGLGLRHAKFQNHAHLMKLGWKLVTRRDDFWVRIVRDKYRCGNDLFPIVDAGRRGSNVWAGIKATWKKVEEGIERIGDGCSVKWKHDRSGEFTVKSAYNLLSQANMDTESSWEKIWRLRVPQRCRTFMWLAARKSLLTNVTRYRRGLSNDDCCSICNRAPEDAIHVFRDCYETKRLWRKLVPVQNWRKFCVLNFDAWFHWNVITKSGQGGEWNALFTMICWWLWKRRNLALFEGKRVSNEFIIANATALLSNLREIQRHLGGVPLQGVRSMVVNDKWRPPEQGWVKLNVDGAFSVITDACACGGLLRNNAGDFLSGFFGKLIEGDAMSAELWACLYGLKFAWVAGYSNIILESDASNVIELISVDPVECHDDYNILKEIRALLNSNWNVRVEYVNRGCNKAADLLAKRGLAAHPGFHTVTDVFQDLASVLALDSASDVSVSVVP